MPHGIRQMLIAFHELAAPLGQVLDQLAEEISKRGFTTRTQHFAQGLRLRFQQALQTLELLNFRPLFIAQQTGHRAAESRYGIAYVVQHTARNLHPPPLRGLLILGVPRTLFLLH